MYGFLCQEDSFRYNVGLLILSRSRSKDHALSSVIVRETVELMLEAQIMSNIITWAAMISRDVRVCNLVLELSSSRVRKKMNKFEFEFTKMIIIGRGPRGKKFPTQVHAPQNSRVSPLFFI